MRKDRLSQIFKSALIALLVSSPFMNGYIHAADNANDQNTHDAFNGPKNPEQDDDTGDPCDENRQGSPVILKNKEFIWNDTDVSIPGRRSLALTRTYRAFDAREGYFGKGWTTECEKSLIKVLQYRATDVEGVAEAVAQYVYRLSNGRRYYFDAVSADIYTSPDGLPGYTLLINSDNTVDLTMVDGSSESYNAIGQLISDQDRFGNKIIYTYSDGALSRVSDEHGRFLQYVFDSTGHVTSVTDHASREWVYFYNADGTLASVTNPAGGIRRYEYVDGVREASAQVYPLLSAVYDETDILIVSVSYGESSVVDSYSMGENTYTYTERSGFIYKTDSVGASWAYKVDEQGHVIEVMPPVNRGTPYIREFDADGNMVKLVDMLGTEFTSSYDTLGRLTSTSSPDGTTTFAYQGNTNWLTTITSPTGRLSQTAYDNLGNPTTMTDAAGNVTTISYAANGDITSVTDAEGNRSTLVTSPAGFPISATDPLGRTVTFDYDLRGNVISLTNPAGETSVFTYDLVDREISFTDEQGLSIQTTYDTAGRVVSVRDAGGYETLYQYDTYGRITNETRPDSYSMTYAYQIDNMPATVTDSRGRILQYTYDRNKQTTAVNYSGDTPSGGTDRRSYNYDVLGRITSIGSSGPNIAYTYDLLGRVLSEQQGRSTTTYTYNQEGEVISSEHEGETISYNRDARGLLGGLVTPAGVHGFVYDKVGRLLQHTRPGNQSTTASYDAAGRLATLDHSLLTGDSLRYTWDTLDRIIQIDGTQSGSRSYTYDAIDRLTTVNADFSYQYQYDQRHNRSESGQIHDEFNKLLEDENNTYTYDAVGNLISRVDKLTGTTTEYDYNSSDRMTSVSQVQNGVSSVLAQYTYDGLGRRTSKVASAVTTYFQWAGDTLISESASTFGEPARRYRYGGGFMPFEYTVDTSHYQVAGDHLMTPTDLVDSSGTQHWQNTTGPFGEFIGEAGGTFSTVDFNIRFVGQYFDEETNLNYNNQRYYNPETGAYLRSDPLKLAGGMNGYAYAYQNPVMYADPTGETPWGLLFGGADLAYQLYKNGNNWRCVNWGSVGMSLLGGGLLNGLTKGIFRFKSVGSHTWGATKHWMKKHGIHRIRPGQHRHHWLFERNQGIGQYVPDWIKNQPWNINPISGPFNEWLGRRPWLAPLGAPSWAPEIFGGAGLAAGGGRGDCDC